MAKTNSIQDLFTGANLNTVVWTQFTGGSATFSYDQASGLYAGSAAQVNFPATTSSSTDGDLTTVTTYDLTSSSFLLNVLGVSGAAATHTDCILRMKVDASNNVEIFYEAGTLFFSQVVAGSQTNNASVAYNASTHAYWRIRETAGTTYWETSHDGQTFTVQFSVADPITLTTVTPLIGGICFGIDTSPTPFIFRYANFPNQIGWQRDFKVGDGMIIGGVAN